MKSEINWIKAKCPHCGEEYIHVKAYNPNYCGKATCREKERERLLKEHDTNVTNEKETN